jgi:uncharacterized protein
VLILLPPSEGKAIVTTGAPVDLATLSFPALTSTRASVVQALDRVAHGSPARARRVLGLSPRQDAELERDRVLMSSPAGPASAVYTGVLYDALGYRSLPAVARRRVDAWVVVTSALWGAVRMKDQIPAYRLSGDATLPRLGKVSSLWRDPLNAVLPEAAGRGVVLDLRSSAYASMWVPTGDLAERTAVARVLQRRPDGSVKVVSHHNKATKGRLVAALARTGGAPRTLSALAEALGTALADVDVEVDLVAPTQGGPGRLDVVVNAL